MRREYGYLPLRKLEAEIYDGCAHKRQLTGGMTKRKRTLWKCPFPLVLMEPPIGVEPTMWDPRDIYTLAVDAYWPWGWVESPFN